MAGWMVNWRGAIVALAIVTVALPQAASAQVDDRLARIETQLRALQRQVFPGGDQRFFEPEITQQTTTTGQPTTPTVASTSALTDVLTRLEAIEVQLAQLTAASEVNQNALSLLEGRLAAIEAGAASAPVGVAATSNPPLDLLTPAEAPVAGPTPERLAAVQAILKPATEDAGDDEYTYGFRLWDAGFYPEAQQQLALFLERYPTHSRESFARNLLGRAYLDAGDARTAAAYFLENYLDDGQAARAPDSLLYLAQAAVALNDTARACLALSEFGRTYPALATGRLKTQYDANVSRVTCE